MFLPGDESRVVVTSEATQNIVLVNIESGTVEGAIPTNAQGSHMVGLTRDGIARVDVGRRARARCRRWISRRRRSCG